MHWVARQKLVEIPNDEAEVNTRDIHKCDGQAHDPDTMVAPLTPKPTRKAEALAKAPPTIDSSRQDDATSCLLWIDKAKSKDKMYIWVSVLWKTIKFIIMNR